MRGGWGGWPGGGCGGGDKGKARGGKELARRRAALVRDARAGEERRRESEFDELVCGGTSRAVRRRTLRGRQHVTGAGQG
ncbi:hypothetical protein GCM10010353_72490 [Streptomyces chryseus]|nr:hypothetical protein GCM10010353_72490 [Streptomyces chryseus]